MVKPPLTGVIRVHQSCLSSGHLLWHVDRENLLPSLNSLNFRFHGGPASGSFPRIALLLSVSSPSLSIQALKSKFGIILPSCMRWRRYHWSAWSCKIQHARCSINTKQSHYYLPLSKPTPISNSGVEAQRVSQTFMTWQSWTITCFRQDGGLTQELQIQ